MMAIVAKIVCRSDRLVLWRPLLDVDDKRAIQGDSLVRLKMLARSLVVVVVVDIVVDIVVVHSLVVVGKQRHS